MSEKIPVQQAIDSEEVKLDVNLESDESQVEVVTETQVEARVDNKESLKTAELEDFTPDVIEKAKKYKERISAYESSMTDTQDRLVEMSWNDPDRATTARELRQAEKERSRINADLADPEGNLLRAERQFYNKFMETVADGAGENLTPEDVILVYDEKFARLESSISESNSYIEEHRKAYGLNTRRAYEDPVLGPKMLERDELNKELAFAREMWEERGGLEIDKAREMVAVKKALDLLPDEQVSSKAEISTVSEVIGQPEEVNESVDDDQEKDKNLELLFSGYMDRLNKFDLRSLDQEKELVIIKREISGLDDLSSEEQTDLMVRISSELQTQEESQGSAEDTPARVSVADKIKQKKSGLNNEIVESLPVTPESERKLNLIMFDDALSTAERSLRETRKAGDLSKLPIAEKRKLEGKVAKIFPEGEAGSVEIVDEDISIKAENSARELIVENLNVEFSTPANRNKAKFETLEAIMAIDNLSPEQKIKLRNEVVYYLNDVEKAEAKTQNNKRARGIKGFFSRGVSKKDKAIKSYGSGGSGPSEKNRMNIWLAAFNAWIQS